MKLEIRQLFIYHTACTVWLLEKYNRHFFCAIKSLNTKSYTFFTCDFLSSNRTGDFEWTTSWLLSMESRYWAKLTRTPWRRYASPCQRKATNVGWSSSLWPDEWPKEMRWGIRWKTDWIKTGICGCCFWQWQLFSVDKIWDIVCLIRIKLVVNIWILWMHYISISQWNVSYWCNRLIKIQSHFEWGQYGNIDTHVNIMINFFYLPWLSTDDPLQQQPASHSSFTRSRLRAVHYSCITVMLTADP